MTPARDPKQRIILNKSELGGIWEASGRHLVASGGIWEASLGGEGVPGGYQTLKCRSGYKADAVKDIYIYIYIYDIRSYMSTCMSQPYIPNTLLNIGT